MLPMKKTITLLMVFVGLSCFAQPDLPTDPAPIDGGVLLLAAAGAGYGYKKMKNRELK